MLKHTTSMVLPLALLCAGCGHLTQVATEPAGARVFVNGQRICAETPCLWESKVGLPRRFHLQVQKEGYREVDLYVDREVWVLPYLAGLVFAPYGGYLLAAASNRTTDLLSFQLEPSAATYSTPAPPSPQAPPLPAAPQVLPPEVHAAPLSSE